MMTLEEIKAFRAANGLTATFDLSGADLSGADLHETSLYKADLSGANLSGADLHETNLRRADLSWADLSGVDLRWADLSGTNLYGADLSGANLHKTNLRGADLSWTDLRGALGIYLPSIVDPRGYQPIIQITDNAPRLIAGCRDFTFDEARRHWGTGYQGDRHIGNRYLFGLALLDSDHFRRWLQDNTTKKG